MTLRFDITLGAGPNHGALRASATVGQGVTLLSGPSGAGKSTLLALLAGVIHPHRGVITFGDLTWATEGRSLVPSHLRGIGWQPQAASLVPYWTARDHLRASERYRPELPGLTTRAVQALALDGLLDRPVATLSAGEAQRVALLRALAACRGLLLLDEPVTALQPALAQESLRLIAALTREQGWTTLLVSHQPCDGLSLVEVLALDGGVLVSG